MPHIHTEVQSSLDIGYRSSLEIGLLRPRLITDQVPNLTNVTNTFTSWDQCMMQFYCKWPAIVGLVIGGLIILSVITCITRCLCCGYSFCCSCFSCLNCCGCCGGCCNGRRSIKYRGGPTSEYQNQGYNAPPPMMMSGGIEKSQFARFSMHKPKPVNEDALPVMPSWDTATSVHVLDETEVSKATESRQVNPQIDQNIPLVTAAAPTGMSSPLLRKDYDLVRLSSGSSPNSNNGYRIPNNFTQERPDMNLVSQYSPSPYAENGVRGNGAVYGRSPSPFSERGNGPPMIPYNKGARSASPIIERSYGAPPMIPYNEGARSASPFGERGRAPPPPQIPYHESARPAYPFDQNQFTSPGPGGRTPGLEYGLAPTQDQRPVIGYQGNRF